MTPAKEALKDTAIVLALVAILSGIASGLTQIAQTHPILAFALFVLGATVGTFTAFYFAGKRNY